MSSDNLILEHLRAIRGTVERLSDDILVIKQRLGSLEHQYATISTRLDRLDERVLRMERSLDLVET
ncbi:hypothetical protein ACIQUB_00775 [Rhizobium sp. NPDC090275]|uniref:hypothetical protein n=1 Tax=Rhizobium sp. NPDC090275 TaxID=3364498 RepID=UPI000DDD8176